MLMEGHAGKTAPVGQLLHSLLPPPQPEGGEIYPAGVDPALQLRERGAAGVVAGVVVAPFRVPTGVLVLGERPDGLRSLMPGRKPRREGS